MPGQMKPLELLVKTHVGGEQLLLQELETIANARSQFEDGSCNYLMLRPEIKEAGVSLKCDISLLYRIALRSRLATKVFVKLGSFKALEHHDFKFGLKHLKNLSFKELFQGISFDSVLIKASTQECKIDSLITMTRFFKDVLDAQNPRTGLISVNTFKYVNKKIDYEEMFVRGYQDEFDVYICAVDHMQQRIYESSEDKFKSPLRPTIAAACVRHFLPSDLDRQIREKHVVVDPFCGSGTFLFESAIHLLGLHPGYLMFIKHVEDKTDVDIKTMFKFLKWKNHVSDKWNTQLKLCGQEALTTKVDHEFIGSDGNVVLTETCTRGVARLGLSNYFHIKTRAIDDHEPYFNKRMEKPGLVLTNPPWAYLGNKKLNERETRDEADPMSLRGLYSTFGDFLRREFMNWNIGVLGPDTLPFRNYNLVPMKITFKNIISGASLRLVSGSLKLMFIEGVVTPRKLKKFLRKT